MAHPMGDSKRDELRVDFDRRLKLEFHGSKIISDGGFLAYRELDDALGLTEIAGDVFQDSRSGKNGWHGMTGLFRQSVFGRLGGGDILIAAFPGGFQRHLDLVVGHGSDIVEEFPGCRCHGSILLNYTDPVFGR